MDIVLTALTAELVATPQPSRKDSAVTVKVKYVGDVIYVSVSTDTVDLGLLDRDDGPFTWALKHQGNVFLLRHAPMIVGSPNDQMRARHGKHESYPAWQYPQSTRLDFHTTLSDLIERISMGELGKK